MSKLSNVEYIELISDLYQQSLDDVFGKIKIPKKLYHYTNMESAQKILENNKIRFTHAYFMNDSQEIKKGLQIIWSIAEEIWTKCDQEKNHDIAFLLYSLANTLIITLETKQVREEHLSKLEEQMNEKWVAQLDVFKNLMSRDVYLSCFSEEEACDNLPMWYMYGDQAKGVNLGYDAISLLSYLFKF